MQQVSLSNIDIPLTAETDLSTWASTKEEILDEAKGTKDEQDGLEKD
jgi:hypothetical protein